MKSEREWMESFSREKVQAAEDREVFERKVACSKYYGTPKESFFGNAGGQFAKCDRNSFLSTMNRKISFLPENKVECEELVFQRYLNCMNKRW